MDISNKKLGSNFERELAEILSKEGWWVTLLTPNQHTGAQPADLIAVRNNTAILIDCKTCNTHLFSIKRVEQNQWNASERFLKCGNNEYYIAIKYNNNIYLIPIEEINRKEKNIDLNLQKKWK